MARASSAPMRASVRCVTSPTLRPRGVRGSSGLGGGPPSRSGRWLPLPWRSRSGSRSLCSSRALAISPYTSFAPSCSGARASRSGTATGTAATTRLRTACSRRRSHGWWVRGSCSWSRAWPARRCSSSWFADTSALSARGSGRSGSASAPSRCWPPAVCRLRSARHSGSPRRSRCSAAGRDWPWPLLSCARSQVRWPGCSPGSQDSRTHGLHRVGRGSASAWPAPRCCPRSCCRSPSPRAGGRPSPSRHTSRFRSSALPVFSCCHGRSGRSEPGRSCTRSAPRSPQR